jgi:hypothetical protein
MTTRGLLVLCIGLLPLSGVYANESLGDSSQNLARPLTYRLGQEFLIDSNILRLPDGQPVPLAYLGKGRGDTIYRTYGGISYANIIANQNLQLDLNLEIRQYANFSSLSRNSMGLSGSIGGDLDRAWYYEASITASDTAGDFVNQNGLDANTLRNLGVSARLGYRFTPTWSTYGVLRAGRRVNSAQSLSSADTSQNSLEFGLRFDSGGRINAELGLSHRGVDYLNPQTFDALGNRLPLRVSNSFTSDQIVGRVNYQPTGQSKLTGSIGLGSTRFDELTQRNASNFLFGFDYRYVFSGLAEMGVQISRDLAGDAFSFSSPVIATKIGIDATWRPSGRLALTGELKTNSRSFSSDPSVVLGANVLNSDKVLTTSLTAQYEFSRTIRMVAGFNRQSRQSDSKNFVFTSNAINLGIVVSLD